MYEELTAFIPRLQLDKTVNADHNYKKAQIEFERTPVNYIDKYLSSGGPNYQIVLQKAGIEWGDDPMRNADVTKLDGTTVMALLIGIFRADCFCPGTLIDFFDNGCIVKWLTRLKEINEET